MSGHFKYKNKLFTSSTNPLNGLAGRVAILEDNEYKVTYYEVVSTTSGTITPPTGATFNDDEFGDAGNAILSTLATSGKPNFETPVTAGGAAVTVSLNTTTGAWITSGAYTAPSVAIIYSIRIAAINYQNLNYDNIIEYEEINLSSYNTIQEEGTSLPQRATLNFIGPAVTATDDPINNRTNVTITATGGGGGPSSKLFNYYNFI